MIQTIETLAEFGQLHNEWNETLQASRSDCLFLTWEWLHTWWRHLSGDRKLCLVTARNGHRLDAIVPLSRRAPRFPIPLGRRFEGSEFLGVGTVGSDYLDLIVRQEAEEQVLPELARYMTREKSLLKLAQINRESPVVRMFSGHWAERGGRLRETASNICPFIRLEGHSWESYLATLGSEHRYSFRRKLKSLSSRFEVRFEAAGSEEERREALTNLLTLHNARWDTRGGTDAFSRQQLISFHEEMSALALQRGWLRLYTLRLDGKAAASIYGFRYGRVFYFYQSGFDPACAKHSVGLVAMGLAIQSALAEGAEEYDLLHGDESYKFHWAKETRQIGTMEFYPSGVLGLLAKQFQATGQGMKRMVREVLPRPVADKLARARRNKAIGSVYASFTRQDRRFQCVTPDGDR